MRDFVMTAISATRDRRRSVGGVPLLLVAIQGARYQRNSASEHEGKRKLKGNDIVVRDVGPVQSR